MSFRYGDVVRYNGLLFMVIRRAGHHWLDRTIWRGVLIDPRRRDIEGAIMSIGMSRAPTRVK